MTESVEALLKEAEQKFASERYNEGIRLLNHALRFPEYRREVYERYAFALNMLGKHQSAELFEQVLLHPRRADAFFQLGNRFIEEGMFGQALAPLYRCYQLAPKDAVVNYTLAYALMKEFQLEAALSFMRRAYESEPRIHVIYYMAYLNLLLGNPEQAEPYLLELESKVRQEEEGMERLKYLREFRKRLLAHTPKGIRDFHFAQYGTVLLRVFKDDFPHAQEDPAHGRFAVASYNYYQIASVLKAFQLLIETVVTKPAYSYVAPVSQQGTPLAIALSRILEVPLAAFSDTVGRSPGIIVAVNSDEINEIASSCIDHPEHLIFAFSVDWTRETAMLPDVIGYLAQLAFLQWQERIEIGENGEAVRLPADERNPVHLADEIMNQLGQVDQAYVSAMARYFKERQELWKIGLNTDRPRKRFLVESPLGGARFM
jgi:tetratricopeptide (TPR) repeat protein